MRTLAVFARWPEPGKVKTRLSPSLPSELACDLQRAMLRDVLEAAREAAADRRVLVWADAPPSGRQPFPGSHGFEQAVQRGADLGERLEAAFEQGLAARGDRAVVVGSDAPELSPVSLAAAFQALESHDLVIGPTHDGGYHLIGLSRRAPSLFRGMAWSTDQVLRGTLERAAGEDLTVARLDPLADVDTPEDLVGLIARCLERGKAAPRHTVAVLASFGLLPSRR